MLADDICLMRIVQRYNMNMMATYDTLQVAADVCQRRIK